jgi:hypothetical protein
VLLVNPLVWLSAINRNDIFDWLNIGLARLTVLGNRLFSLTQNGKLRWYVMSFTIGIVLILTYMILR